jgi:SAM-dependent methyltransferase
MQKVSACPICHQPDLIPFLSCRDYTVSHETFHLSHCTDCDFVITNPQPDARELPAYYQSDAYISHSNKSQNLIDRIYKFSRNYTIRWKYKLTQHHTVRKPASILDYGCGTGAFLKKCQENSMVIAGVEPSQRARNEAARHTKISIATRLEEVNATFDVITLWHVLEHVSDLNKTLENLRDRLTENGTMFIAVPNLKSHDAKHYGKHWAAYDVPRHLWHFSRRSMETLLGQHSLKLHTIVPMLLDAYYVSLLSEKYRNGNSGLQPMAKAVVEGWTSNRAARKTNEYSSLIYIVRK